MKTKTKTLVVVEIAIVLCSLFLAALPAIAADQNQEMQKASANTITTASEDDYVLDIYGNANEDDTIDMGDVVYTKLAIFGNKPKTELCDAKYDGRINVLDVIQTKLIILGKEKELTFVDKNRIVTVKKPVKRVVAFSIYATEVMQSLKATDKIVGVSKTLKTDILFPELVDLPCVGSAGAPDYEKIVELQPDLFFWYVRSAYDKSAHKLESLLPSTTIVRISCTTPDIYIEDVRKIGYILDRKDEAEEFIDFYEECLKQIDEKVETISEDEKPRVFYTMPTYFPTRIYTFSRPFDVHQVIVGAGGINIAADIAGAGSYPTIDPEWVTVQNPEIIIGGNPRFGYNRMGDTAEADMSAIRDKIMLYPAWGHTAAVESGKVYLLDTTIVWQSAHHFIGTVYMAKLLHPDLFEDLDPQSMHQEYLDRFLGLDINMDEYVFVYPPFE